MPRFRFEAGRMAEGPQRAVPHDLGFKATLCVAITVI